MAKATAFVRRPLLQQHQLMFLQTVSTERKKQSSSSPLREQAAVSRKKKLRDRRRQRRLRKQEVATQDMLRMIKDVPRRSEEDFEGFFDAIMPPYSLSRMDELLERIQSKAKSGQRPANDQDLPLPLVLQTVLQTGNPTDDLQIHVLRFLLYDDRHAVNRQHQLPVDPGAVDTLLLAREKAVIHPLFWNKDDLRQTTQEADRILAPLQKHRTKTPDQIRMEAMELGLHLRNHLPPKYYKGLVTLLESYVGMDNLDAAPSTTTLEDVYEPERVGRPPIRLLGPALYDTLETHFCLVCHDVARFFYLTAPEADPGLLKSTEQWNISRGKFSKTLLELQEEIIQVKDRYEAAYEEEEFNADITATTAQKQSKNAQDKNKRRRIQHVKYQVTTMGDEMQNLNVSDSPSSRMVFLDNLPIDVSNQEIRELYSRCGPIRTVSIYNQRPDLDPGPLSQTQIQQRRKKQLKSVSARPPRWKRPQTPVYAIVEFADEKGYQRAIDDTLRIFGMLIRRHPVRSTPAAAMSTLFIEDLSEGKGCLELEYEFERAVGVQVSVVSGQDTSVLAGSCEISFPSFDVAWESAIKLQELNVIKERGGKVNWFRTPRNAEDWWTRRRGFDF